MDVFTDCQGAPWLPLLYIAVNMCFNISALNLLKVSSALVSSLSITLSGNLSQLGNSTSKLVMFHLCFTTVCSATLNIHPHTSSSIYAGRFKFGCIFCHWCSGSFSGSHVIQLSSICRSTFQIRLEKLTNRNSHKCIFSSAVCNNSMHRNIGFYL